MTLWDTSTSVKKTLENPSVNANTASSKAQRSSSLPASWRVVCVWGRLSEKGNHVWVPSGGFFWGFFGIQRVKDVKPAGPVQGFGKFSLSEAIALNHSNRWRDKHSSGESWLDELSRYRAEAGQTGAFNCTCTQSELQSTYCVKVQSIYWHESQNRKLNVWKKQKITVQKKPRKHAAKMKAAVVNNSTSKCQNQYAAASGGGGRSPEPSKSMEMNSLQCL